MKEQEKLQNLDEEQLETVTGGTNPGETALQTQRYNQLEHLYNVSPPGSNMRLNQLDRIVTTIPLKIREPLHSISEQPKIEQAHQTGWVSENPNKRRRIDVG
jgi:hypothetical protein